MFFTIQRRGCFSNHVSFGMLAIAASLLVGCASTGSTPSQPTPARARPEVAVQTPTQQNKSIDPPPIKISDNSCEMRLHDLCGPLLLYLTANDKFPEKLEDLNKLGVLEKGVDFNCPVTHKPYVYVREGLLMPDGKGGVLVYDSEPHEGIRWAIEMVWPEGVQRPLAMVIPLNEATFRALKPNP